MYGQKKLKVMLLVFILSLMGQIGFNESRFQISNKDLYQNCAVLLIEDRTFVESCKQLESSLEHLCISKSGRTRGPGVSAFSPIS